MNEHTAGPQQLFGLAGRLRWTHPGYGEFITKLQAAEALEQYASELEADTVREAAPELLEALRAVVEDHEERVVTTELPQEQPHRILVMNNARAAIANAEDNG